MGSVVGVGGQCDGVLCARLRVLCLIHPDSAAASTFSTTVHVQDKGYLDDTAHQVSQLGHCERTVCVQMDHLCTCSRVLLTQSRRPPPTVNLAGGALI